METVKLKEIKKINEITKDLIKIQKKHGLTFIIDEKENFIYFNLSYMKDVKEEK